MILFKYCQNYSIKIQSKLIELYLGNADEIDDLSKEVGDNTGDIKDNGNDVKQNIKDIKKNKNDVKGNLDHLAKVL